MFKKIVINNVGILKAFATPGSPGLAKLTTIYARNGRGKTTLTSVLRAARDGSSDTVLGRRSLGVETAPQIVLVRDAGTIRFDGKAWSVRNSPIEVFDTTFITDNIHAGEVVDLTHDRGLFSVIIGSEGVRLSKRLQYFVAAAKKAATALKEATSGLKGDVPTSLTVDQFVALRDQGRSLLDQRLIEAERRMKAVRDADQVARLKPLSTLPYLEIAPDIADVLQSKLDGVEASARLRLVEHFRRFQLGRGGEEWVKFGIDHLHDDTCPFCGRTDADELGLLSLYGQIFGDLYKAHYSRIGKASEVVETVLGPTARSSARQTINSNVDTLLKLREYFQVVEHLPDLENVMQSLSASHDELARLFDLKRKAPTNPLEAVAMRPVFEELDRANAVLTQYNRAVAAINESVVQQKNIPQTTEEVARRVREDIVRMIRRADPGVQGRVEKYEMCVRRDLRAKHARTVAQTRLKAANEAAAFHYSTSVNSYLSRFGATFRISSIRNSMPGNAGSSDYALLIRGHTIARGRGREVGEALNFRSALSAGDKTTLAFAFFLASLDQDKKLSEKIVVFDDPLSSHDSYRKGKTVEELRALVGKCAQVIVLSHDEFFIRDLCSDNDSIPSATYQIEYRGDGQWSDAVNVDPDQLCMSEHAKSVGALQAFCKSRQGNPDDVVAKVRKVLETHYRRSYPAYFSRAMTLGQIAEAIRTEGSLHPCFTDLARINSCNVSTRDKHHGDDPLSPPRTGVDPDELAVIAYDALELIGAVRKGATASVFATGLSTV